MAFSCCTVSSSTSLSRLHSFAPIPSSSSCKPISPFILHRSSFAATASCSSIKLSERSPTIAAASSSNRDLGSEKEEEVFFDGGPHYGDLVLNLVFGFSVIWLPLTLAAVLRALFLRYRFTSVRITILSGLAGEDRKDFTYNVIKDVSSVPRFIGEWGDVVITLTDGTIVDLRSVPKFREITEYCRKKSGQEKGAEELSPSVARPKGFS